MTATSISFLIAHRSPVTITMRAEAHSYKETVMDIPEPRVRRRGMFVHAETPELDYVEQESTEGVSTRLRVSRPRAERAIVASRKPTHAVRPTSPSSTSSAADVRFASETGSHRQARMSR